MNDAEIITLLQNDGIGVLPTDTVYGVVGRLLSKEAVQRIYEVKQRDTTKRVGTILIANATQLTPFVSSEIIELAFGYWPSSTSVVLPLDEKLFYAHQGHGTLAFRIPDFPALITLLEKTGPLATSSANLEGQASATTIEQARQYFGETVDFYVDGGDLSHRQPSRIIEILSDGSIKQIRT